MRVSLLRSMNVGRRRVRPMSMDATPINAHTMHWFAYLGPEPAADQAVQSDANPQEATALNDGHLSDGENEGLWKMKICFNYFKLLAFVMKFLI